MPFRLKNTGATYQRLVNKIFKEQINKTMEVYVDEMLVKAPQQADHIKNHVEPAPKVPHKVELEQVHIWNLIWPIFGILSHPKRH
ncbi:hypothetical protein CerSpe_212120 [Prunus speciosa]